MADEIVADEREALTAHWDEADTFTGMQAVLAAGGAPLEALQLMGGAESIDGAVEPILFATMGGRPYADLMELRAALSSANRDARRSVGRVIRGMPRDSDGVIADLLDLTAALLPILECPRALLDSHARMAVDIVLSTTEPEGDGPLQALCNMGMAAHRTGAEKARARMQALATFDELTFTRVALVRWLRATDREAGSAYDFARGADPGAIDKVVPVAVTIAASHNAHRSRNARAERAAALRERIRQDFIEARRSNSEATAKWFAEVNAKEYGMSAKTVRNLLITV